MEYFMRDYSSSEADFVKNVRLMLSVFVCGMSAALWFAVVLISPDEDVGSANAEVTVNLSKQTQNMKDCVLLEKDDEYYLSCKIKD
jgi:hypothetical protein